MQKQLFSDYRFWLGVAIRMLGVMVFVPVLWRDLFVPFLNHVPDWFPLDPWTPFLQDGGRSDAFPYGVPMYLWHGVGTLVGGALGYPVIGLWTTIFAADLFMFALLLRFNSSQPRTVLWLYWLSPIVLAVVYWHGQLDIFPTLLLLTGLYLLKKERADKAAMVFATACAAKLSMLLPLPFVFFYLLRNNNLYPHRYNFLLIFISVFAAWQFPLWYSGAYQHMVFGTPEIERVFDAFLRIGHDHKLYLMPMLFLGQVFWFTRYNRVNFDLLLAFMSLAFISILSLTNAPPGWYIWILPTFVLVARESIDKAVLYALQILIAFVAVGFFTGVQFRFGAEVNAPLDIKLPVDASLPMPYDVIRSIMAVSLMIFGWWLWREAITKSTFHRLRWNPLAIGIAGDSGAGKDTLSAAMTNIFGAYAVASLSGDDYHKYERGAPMWKVLTHLDPRGNDLDLFQRDALRLMQGENIVARHYDHTVGRFTRARAVVRNDVVIVSGLHALMSPVLRQGYDLKVYLDMDEDLRRALKLNRDVKERGQSIDKVLESMEKRKQDAKEYIHPQAQYADVIFSLVPVKKDDLEFDKFNPDTLEKRLDVCLKDGSIGEGLAEMLIGVCGLQVETSYISAEGSLRLQIEGSVTSEDIAMAVEYANLRMKDLILPEPIWQNGMLGLMQLICLVVIDNALRRRRAMGG